MTRGYRTFFWPAVVILIGLVWLLVDIGQIPADRLVLLVNLWPLVLIVIGLEIIVRRTLQGAIGDLAAALVVLLAVVGSAAYIVASPSPAAMHTLDVSGVATNLHEATLEVDAGASTINISAGEGSTLYRAHIEYPGPQPDVSFDPSGGTLRISQRNTNPFGIETGHFTLDLQLSPDVTWHIQENTGAATDTMNLPNVKVSGVEINTGASHEEITLGPPSSVVPIQINGGALTVRVHRPNGVEAVVTVDGGAINLNADGHASHAVGSLEYRTPGFGGAPDAYRIEINGGAINATLDVASASG